MSVILLVDDVKNFLDLERSFLRRTTSSLHIASTGVEAIKVAREKRPDLIMLDIEMPEMSGIEACRILKNDSQTAHIPIVMVTAMTGRLDECRRAGCDHFVKKPITEDEFLGVIQRFVPIRIRQLKRIPVALTVEVRPGGSENALTLRSKDLSEKGLFLLSDSPLPLGTGAACAFELPDRSRTAIKTGGVVVRVIEPGNKENLSTGMGIELTGLAEIERAALHSFIDTFE
jgi:CheY-like chemotaxis protein